MKTVTLTANSPIGLFDSGVGGLTILKKLREQLPNESFVYLGDTANLPYGEKSSETILRYSIDNARFLQEQSVKMIVVACSTATVHALAKLQSLMAVPVVGVVFPAVQAVRQATQFGRIGILGTTATIRSGTYEREIRACLPHAQICSVAAPMLAPLIEENLLEHPATRLLLRDYLVPMQTVAVDCVLLACTHYPLLSQMIREEMGPQVNIIDPAQACAQEVRLQLERRGLVCSKTALPEFHYYVSADPERFHKVSAAFLPTPPQRVVKLI